MAYVSAVAHELMVCNAKLKEVRDVLDALIADYDEVPVLKQLFTKESVIGITENVVRAQTAVEIIVTDVKEREKNG